MAEIWSVHASEDACEIAMRAPGAGRVASDEVMIDGPIAADIRRAIDTVDPDALVRRADEGWAEVVLDRSDARDVFARLSELELPASGYVQGEIARVAVRVFVHEDHLSLFVRPPWETHLRRCIERERTPP